MRNIAITGTVLLGLLCWSINAATNRTTVIVSDTHFGVGHDSSGGWCPWEDFRWRPEFAQFLTFIGSKGPTDLVLNGDTFELWQSSIKCSTEKAEVGCSETEALERLRRVFAEHGPELDALRAFAAKGTNRIYIVPGNHDAALLFTAVHEEVVRRLGKNVVVELDGEWRSEDRRLLAVHGHQFDEANRFPHWPHPFTKDGRIERPWGDLFVQQFYDEVETKYPIIDNITREADALLYGMAAEGWRKSVGDGRRFGLFILQESSWRLSAETLGPRTRNRATGPWHVAAVKHQGARFFADLTPADHPGHAELKAQAAVLTEAFDKLSEDDIREICDERAKLKASGIEISLCPTLNAGGKVETAFDYRDWRLRRYLRTLTKGDTPDFDVAILSHTHQVEKPRKLQFDRRAPVIYANTGAWQRVIGVEEIEKRRRANHLGYSDILKQWKVTDLPACYSYVLIEPYTSAPVVHVRYWTEGADGRWRSAEACPSH